MKPVIQLEPTGCGIASVAAVAGLPYRHVQPIANALGIYAGDKRLWSDTAHVRRLLGYFGFIADPAEIPFISWQELPKLALLAIKWHRERGRPFWHWVVFVREGENARVLDSKRSLRKHVRTDFGRMRPKWYIPVRRPGRPA